MTRGQHDVISVFANIADALLADLPTQHLFSFFLFRCSCCRFIVGYVALNYVGQYQQQNNNMHGGCNKMFAFAEGEAEEEERERERLIVNDLP